jgi:hypothetical protein
MRVHEDVEAILFCLAQYADSVFNPCLIVLSRTCMFYRLPCEDISYSIVAPASEAREMCGGIVEGKWSVYERDIVAVKELLGDMRRQIRGRGELRIGGAINSVLWIRKISVQILAPLCRCALTRMTSRFWGSRNVRPSIRSRMGDMIYEASKEKGT